MNKFIRNLRCNGDCELVYLRPFYNLDRDNIHYVCDYDEDKIGVNVFALYEENQELKKQLEEKTKIGVADHKYASKCEDKVITMENQQKEFIEYMENEINKFKELEKFAREVFDNNKIINIGLAQKTIEENNLLISNFNIILSKYKEIIGVSNEK